MTHDVDPWNLCRRRRALRFVFPFGNVTWVMWIRPLFSTLKR